MLKTFAIAIIMSAVFLSGAQTPSGVPKGATQTAPGTYRFVDKDKKVWIYRHTPFGMQKSLEDAAADKPAAAPEPSTARTATPFGESKQSTSGPVTKVTEDGDKLKFERPTPFGPVRWTRSKSELTDEERKIWEAKQSGASPADKK